MDPFSITGMKPKSDWSLWHIELPSRFCAASRHLLPSIGGSELWALLSVGYAVGTRAARGGLVSDLRDLGSAWPRGECDLSGLRGLADLGTIGDTYALLKDWFWGFTTRRLRQNSTRRGSTLQKGLRRRTHPSLSYWSHTEPSSLPRESWRRSIHRRTSCGERFREEKQKAESRKEGPDAQRRARADRSGAQSRQHAKPRRRNGAERLQELRRTVNSTRRG